VEQQQSVSGLLSVSRKIITLTTDFGEKDGYVAALKGTILNIVEGVRMIDVSHEIAPHDIMEGAYVLSRTAPAFPAGTIHLVVVDPEYGARRKPVAMRVRGQFFVGPNNGIFSLILAGSVPELLVELDNRMFWRDGVKESTGFNARDILAPAAAHLASGVALSNLGKPIETLHPMHWALPITDQEGIQGWVVHVDRFGNCITNIHRDTFRQFQGSRSFKCYVGNTVLHGDEESYAQAESGDPVVIFNSDGILEIAINRGSASMLLDIAKGAPVNIVFGEDRSPKLSHIGAAQQDFFG